MRKKRRRKIATKNGEDSLTDCNIAKATMSVDEYTNDETYVTVPKPARRHPTSTIRKQSIISQPWIRPKTEPNNTPRTTQSKLSPTDSDDIPSGDNNSNPDIPALSPRACVVCNDSESSTDDDSDDEWDQMNYNRRQQVTTHSTITLRRQSTSSSCNFGDNDSDDSCSDSEGVDTTPSSVERARANSDDYIESNTEPRTQIRKHPVYNINNINNNNRSSDSGSDDDLLAEIYRS